MCSFRRTIAIASLGLLCGCGSSLTDATVTGVVTIDGERAPEGIQVLFQPTAKGSSPSSGTTDAEGRYELRYNALTSGATSGEHVVSFTIRYEEDENRVPFVPSHLKGIRIPRALQEDSSLKKTVEAGANQIDLEITTK